MKKNGICFGMIAALLLMTVPVYAGEQEVTAKLNTKQASVMLPSGLNVGGLERQLDAYVEEHKETTAGLAVGVFQNDQVLLEKSYGYVNIEDHLETNEESVFEWGSCTKLITWTCLMQLAEQGKIDLNEDVRTYLPQGFFKKLRYETPVTVIDLMNHSGGWQENYTDLFLEDQEDVKSLPEMLSYMETEQIYEPGTRVAYSNWGTGLAGYLVECVSGQEYSEYVKEHIFKPLDMEHTAIRPDLSDNEWVRTQRMKENCYEADGTTMGTCFSCIPLYPAGMATGTLDDFVKFAQAFAPAKGKKSPLFSKSETLDEMRSPTRYYADDETARNCHGFWTGMQNVPILWHNGGTVGSTSWFAYNIETGVGTVILTNQSEESIYTCGILPKVFGESYFSTTRDKKDISGTYLSLSTCMTGVAKPLRLFSYLMIGKPIDGKYAQEGLLLASMGDDKYFFTIDGMDYTFFAREAENGDKILELPGADYVKVNPLSFYLQILLLVLFVVAAVYSLFGMFSLLIRKLRHKKCALLLLRFVNHAATLVSFCLMLEVQLTLISGYPMFADIKGAVMANAICMLVPIVYVVILFLHYKKADMTKGEKVSVMANAVAGLIMSANILYFNGFIFW